MAPMSLDEQSIANYRREFPVVENYVYLDHAGVAPMSLRVKRELEAFLRQSSEGGAFHYPEWAERIAAVRASCAALIGAESSEVAFVKSTSHGLSLVAAGLGWNNGDNMLYCEKDFPSNIYPWTALRLRGVAARPVPIRQGKIVIEDFANRMDERTRLVSVSSVLFSNGFRVDMEHLGTLCQKKGSLLCVDAIQSLGVVPMDVRRQRIDFLSADAHKWLLGPEGIGIFFCRSTLAERIEPVLKGWKSVQNELDFDHPRLQLKNDAMRFEEGSQNLLGIIGLGAAVDLLTEIGIENIERRVLSLGDQIIREVEKRGFELLTPKEAGDRGGIISFRGGFDPSGLRESLKKQGIMVNVRAGGLRVSPHFYNTEHEIDRLFGAIDRLMG